MNRETEVARRVDRPKGFDFGVPEHSILIGNLDFVETLKEAEVFACLYGLRRYEPLRSPIPEVSIVGKNTDALRKVFEVFRNWSMEEDDDAVSLSFVFLKEGGYLLGITQDAGRLYQRLAGFNRVLVPLQCSNTWAKKFDSRHPMLEHIAEYKKSLVSPFFFSAASHPPVPDVSQLRLERVSPVQGIEPILKFEGSFVHEADVEKNTAAWIALFAHREEDTKNEDSKHPDDEFMSVGGRRRADPKMISERRVEMLARHFPVTLARFRKCARLQTISHALEKEGIAGWQIEQAVCNLVLSNCVAAQRHYAGISQDELAQKIVAALNDRHEVADSIPTLDSLTLEAIAAQIKYDAAALLSSRDNDAGAESLQELLSRLASEGLLSA